MNKRTDVIEIKENIEIHADVSRRTATAVILKNAKISYSRRRSYRRFKSGQFISNFEEQKFSTLSDPLTSVRNLSNSGDTPVEINYLTNETISFLPRPLRYTRKQKGRQNLKGKTDFKCIKNTYIATKIKSTSAH